MGWQVLLCVAAIEKENTVFLLRSVSAWDEIIYPGRVVTKRMKI